MSRLAEGLLQLCGDAVLRFLEYLAATVPLSVSAPVPLVPYDNRRGESRMASNVHGRYPAFPPTLCR